jgi:DNA-binding PadR family transcriptional regulator
MARKMTAGLASGPEILILSSLAGGPKHGYAIMQDAAVFSGVELGLGTLYTAIARLVDEGWIEPAEASGRQRPYRLTDSGLGYLRGQLETMRKVAGIGLRRLRSG